MANPSIKKFRLSARVGAMAAMLLPLGAGTSHAAEELPPFEAPGESYSLVAPGDVGTYHETDTLEPIPSPLTHDLSLHCEAPAVTESSGTWLRRGLWYADLEAVIMSRTWDSDGVFIAEEPSITSPFQVPIRQDEIGASSPGAEGLARLTLGRFLFRDLKNRDHNAEMLIQGGGEWNEELDLQADTAGGIQVPLLLTGLGVRPNFSGATDMELTYSSRLTNWEWNYSVTERLRRDRMELLPSGKWVRRASPGLTREYLAGLRLIDIQENIDWTAENISTLNGSDGTYLIRTSNNLFGIQLGYGMTYETDRWNITLSTKQGFFVVDERSTSNFIVPDAATNVDFATEAHENRLSYLAQMSILARYHIRPNLSLRAGWELMYLTNLALAPNQIDFSPVAAPIAATADSVYHGFTVGTEYYW